MTVHDDTLCALGQGPLWHPLRNHLFLFDILGSRLCERRWGSEQAILWLVDGIAAAAGNLWNAQWGASRDACHTAQGEYVADQKFAAEQTSCAAFGGADLKTVFVTSAAVGLDSAASVQNGMTLPVQLRAQGQKEHQVKLG